MSAHTPQHPIKFNNKRRRTDKQKQNHGEREVREGTTQKNDETQIQY